MAEPKRKKSVLEKLIMGAVIGAAVGSVIGASVSPKDKKKIKDDLVDLTDTVKKKSTSFLSKFLNKDSNGETDD